MASSDDCWGTYARRRPGRASTLPPTGGTSPSAVRTNVDLPEPLGPMTAHSSPAAIVIDSGGRMAAPSWPTTSPSVLSSRSPAGRRIARKIPFVSDEDTFRINAKGLTNS